MGLTNNLERIRERLQHKEHLQQKVDFRPGTLVSVRAPLTGQALELKKLGCPPRRRPVVGWAIIGKEAEQRNEHGDEYVAHTVFSNSFGIEYITHEKVVEFLQNGYFKIEVR